MVPFIAVLLLMALLGEIAPDCNRWMSLRPVADIAADFAIAAPIYIYASPESRRLGSRPGRPVAAIAADFAIAALIYIYASPESSRPDYASVSTGALLAPAFILLLIYGANVVLRTTALRRQITIAEAGQAVIAFLLAADSVLHFAPAAGVVAFAVFCFVLSAAGYTALFTRFAGIAERRNYSVYAIWSAALLLLGCCLCLHPLWLASCLGVAAIVATSAGVRVSRLTLVFHGFLYALAAAFACGWMQYRSEERRVGKE